MGSEIAFRDVAQLVRDVVQPGEVTNVPYIGLEHIEQESLRLNGWGTSSEVDSAKFRFRKGDILFGKLRPYFRKVVRAPFDGICSTDIWVVRAREGYDQGYLFYWMASYDFVDFASKGSEGTRMPRAKWEHVERFTRPRLSLKEQRAIARILGALDDKIELNRRMNETLETMAQALFKSWFVDFDPVVVNALKAGNPIPDKFADRVDHYRNNPDALGLPEHILRLFPARFVDSELGPIPEGWEVKTLGSICHRPQYGYTASANENRVGPKFLRIKDINKLPWINWREVPYCTISDEQQRKYLLRAGDVVIARIADPGHGALIEEQVEAIFASYLIRLRPLDVTYDRYLQYWLRSEPYWLLVKGRQSGSTRANLNAKVLGRFPLVVPDLRVVSAFRQIIGSMRERVVAYVREEDALATLRDTLLPKLISGELRVPDAEKILESG